MSKRDTGYEKFLRPDRVYGLLRLQSIMHRQVMLAVGRQ
jgi:hypothetical protein